MAADVLKLSKELQSHVIHELQLSAQVAVMKARMEAAECGGLLLTEALAHSMEAEIEQARKLESSKVEIEALKAMVTATQQQPPTEPNSYSRADLEFEVSESVPNSD